MKKLTALAFILSTSLMQSAQAAPMIHFSDFIPDADRTQFNGFESIPNNGTFYTGGNGPYSEDGITVQQINGDAGNDIWVTYSGAQHRQHYSWYPNGGDRGYTQITRSDGLDFFDIGLLVGSGFGSRAGTVLYDLLDNGISVLSGSFAPGSDYLGFSGGGFDTVRLADTNITGYTGTVHDRHYNALAIDNIELRGGNSVPEPGSMALLAAGLAGFSWSRRRA